MDPKQLRTDIVQRLRADLVGPLVQDEKLQSRPSDVYMTGLLWPMETRMGGEDDDGELGESEDAQVSAAPGLVGQQRPCAMGISFATSASGQHQVNIEISFSSYVFSQEEDVATPVWSRRPYRLEVDAILIDGETSQILDCGDSDLVVELHRRTLSIGGGKLTTVTLINRATPAVGDRLSTEALTLFQTGLQIRPMTSTSIVPRPPVGLANDSDGESARLLYRDCADYATGHQCSAEWSLEGGSARTVSTTWIPQSKVPAFSDAGDPVFAELAASERLSAEWLAKASQQELATALAALTDAYASWILQRRTEVSSLKEELQPVAVRHLDVCDYVLERMRNGVESITSDPLLRQSFQLANLAMHLQHSWKRDGAGVQLLPLRWRPFQLGFILLAAESTCFSDHAEREVLDLLWFPTGGGKTEAYLALIAMLAWHRRLSTSDGEGNVAVMRYTLRLLTAQQFERAAAMILACERLRLGLTETPQPLPSHPLAEFSIGLWVGRDATPNTFEDARKAKAEGSDASAEQLERCYSCHAHLHWRYDPVSQRVSPYCKTDGCPLGKDLGDWPVHTVDDSIYREPPTLLIGTIDKFAQLPFKLEVGQLFGFDTPHPTSLIVQDELHLISGPLGTIAGAYETAFDWLLTKNGKRPKVIGSTATIRRAQEQVKALFDRDSCQFPPPGLTYNNSGFAVVDEEKPGRLYVGITTAGRSSKFTSQAVAASLLQSGASRADVTNEVRDGYSTLLYYFNSLRELGGAIVQVLDDVPDSIALFSTRRGESPRALNPPEELTSRVSQREIVAILGRLQQSCDADDAVDAVLATNMVSVGVDVARLGLMLVQGQPKTRSEYIQSTSRVGRAQHPGLVVCVMNAAKVRDRSHYETFVGWHGSLYRDVEATSVTPFASRARDKTLRTILVSMIRHRAPVASVRDKPDIGALPNDFKLEVLDEINRRISGIDASELSEAQQELMAALYDWESRKPEQYNNKWKRGKSLLESAEEYAKRMAAGRLATGAWPTMNTMRSVEPSTPFRMVERLIDPSAAPDKGAANPTPPWRA